MEQRMSKLNRSLIVVTVMLAIGTAAAFASDATEWIMKPNQGYVIGANGRVEVVDLRPDDAMIARAQEVPSGTAFFMNGEKVMMIFDRSTIGLHQ
jgi:hypothetical protein